MALTDEEVALRLKLHKSGMTDKEIGLRVGRSSKTIWAWLRSRGLKSNKSPHRLRIEAQSKRREQMVEQGLTNAEIARREGVDVSNIRKWKHRRRADEPLRNVIGGVIHSMENRPQCEIDFLREFFQDLAWAYDHCSIKPDISKFIYEWSIIKGGRVRLRNR